MALALAACSSDADGPEPSGDTDAGNGFEGDAGSGDSEIPLVEGMFSVKVSSTTGASLDHTYRGPSLAAMGYEPTTDWVSCRHVTSPSGGQGPFVAITAGTPASSLDDVKIYIGEVWDKKPMKRTDTYDVSVGGASRTIVEARLGTNNFYWFLYDPATNAGSTCTVELTEFSDTWLTGTISCTGLVPELSATDFEPADPQLGHIRPQPKAAMSASFNCPL